MVSASTRRVISASLLLAIAAGCSDTTRDTERGEASRAPAESEPAPAEAVAYDVPDGWDRRQTDNATVYAAPEGDATVVVVTVSGATEAETAAAAA